MTVAHRPNQSHHTSPMIHERTPSLLPSVFNSSESDTPPTPTATRTSHDFPVEGDIRLRETPSVFGLLQLPFEVLVGDILAILPQPDLASMARVCKAIYRLYQSDYLWQQKFFNEFQYRPNKTLKQLGSSGGWRRIYHAMEHVEVYTWGSNVDCRLGYSRTSRKIYESVPKRVRRLDGIGIVQLAPTGWGSHALDKHGNVWAWGRIMESNSLRSDAVPRMLKRPKNVVQLSAGGEVVLAKDANGQVWQWCRENKVIEVTFGSDRNINNSNRITITKDRVEQISAGWNICSVLTQSGRIFAWRPSQSSDGRCQHRIHVEHPVSLINQGYDGYEASVIDGDKFVQIAAGSDYIIAVTSLEKVYIFRGLDSPHYHGSTDLPQQSEAQPYPFMNQPPQLTLQQHQQYHPEEYEDRLLIETGAEQERVTDIRGRILGEGLYLPIFSEALTRTVTATYEEYDEWERRQRHYRHHPKHASSSTPSTVFRDPVDEACCLRSSSASRPTTISANFENFAIHHSSGKVLWGKGDVQSETLPIVIERLHSNVCQVGFGDHHQGLLTEDGQLRTWGSFSDGALGQGDLRYGCEVPTVVEGPLKNKVVIGIGMAGWQSACLAIDLSEEKVHGSIYDSQSRGYILDRNKDLLIDDGYHSLENTSSCSGSGSGSSSEGFDSSDGEEWISADNDSKGDRPESNIRTYWNQTGETSKSGSAPVAPSTAASSWSSSHSAHHHLSPSCTTSCSQLYNSLNHRHGAANTHSRPTPIRKRSSSLVERYSGSHGYLTHSGSSGGREESRWYMLAMTRLSPILTTYEPLSSTESSLKNRRFSVL